MMSDKELNFLRIKSQDLNLVNKKKFGKRTLSTEKIYSTQFKFLVENSIQISRSLISMILRSN